MTSLSKLKFGDVPLKVEKIEMATKKTVAKEAPKTKIIYLAYDEYDDNWELVWNKNYLDGYAFYATIKVPASSPRRARKPANIGTFEIGLIDEVAA